MGEREQEEDIQYLSQLRGGKGIPILSYQRIKSFCQSELVEILFDVVFVLIVML